MTKKTFIIRFFSCLFFLFAAILAQAQNTTISSKKSYIKFTNNSVSTSVTATSEVSCFAIIYPKFTMDREHISEYDNINFIAKLHDIDLVHAVYINEQEIEWSKDGLFGESVKLETGKNKLTIKVVFTNGEVNETDLQVTYIERTVAADKEIDGL